jgi:hypothetical protein
MMASASADHAQVYDECDHNVMRPAPPHGCRAQSALRADKQRTIGDAVYGCFDPTRKVMSGIPGVIPKSGDRFSDKITHNSA